MVDVRLVPAPEAPTWTTVVQIAVSVAVLIVSAWRARQRAKARMPAGSLTVRVLVPALVFSAAFSAVILAQNDSSGREAVLFALFVCVLIGVIGVILMLPVELIARRLRAVRSRGWLAAALLLFPLCFLLPLGGLIAALAPITLRSLLRWENLELVAPVAAAALIWWSYLRPRDPGLAGVFE